VKGLSLLGYRILILISVPGISVTIIESLMNLAGSMGGAETYVGI